LRHVLEDFGL